MIKHNRAIAHHINKSNKTMKINTNRKRGFTLVELLVVIVIIASLAALSAPMIMGQIKKANKAEAISNSKQIGLALFEFDSDYGSYPDADTLTEVSEAFPNAEVVPTGAADSNACFQQLLQAGIVKSEEIFYSKATGTRKPDGDISSATEAIAAGECGFGYIMNGTDAYSTAGNSSRVIVVSPLVEGGGDTFDINPFGGVAVLYKIDNSASAVKIRSDEGAEDGPAIIAGKDFLEAKFWGTTTPTIVKPKTSN
jgi:prepilin-type N-terminal cleavage/methylation domain-containing protein